MGKAEAVVRELLDLADIKIGGSRPFDIKVNDKRFYRRVLVGRELALGESYMDGWWESKKLDETIARLLSADLRSKLRPSPSLVWTGIKAAVRNQQSVGKARRNAAHHYNIGNDLYRLMLDKRMIYSCGYWKNARSLDEAQEAKLDLICRKLELKPGMTILDIGCGWGGLAKYAAEKYKAKVTGITPAAEQVKLAKANTKGLPVKILQKDYREMTGKFDRVVSVGMFEHVGPKNYESFFKKCKSLLKDGGIMLHHTIGGNRSIHATDPWVDKYIFPGGVIPSLAQIAKAVESELIIEDVQNFGPYYDKTVYAWYVNFKRNWPKLKDKYDERFYRMWEYYLLMFAGVFRARELQLWQVVFKKIEPSKTYIAAR